MAESSLVLVRILGVGTEARPVHDGLGGVHARDVRVRLPAEVAAALVGLGAAEYTGPAASETPGADAASREIAERKRDATVLMSRFDKLPAELRELARNNDDRADDIIRLHRKGLSMAEIMDVLTRPAPAGEDDEAPA